jgi:hypothetical protein
MIYTNRSNDDVSTWNFAHRQIYWPIECSENFSTIECFLLEILKFQKTENSCIVCKIWMMFETLMFWEGNILLNWNFQKILLTNRSIYGQNLRSKHRHSICWCISCYRRNSRKMPITPNRRPKRTYPFGAFHISLESILCTEFELKSDSTVENVPSLGDYI